MTRLSLTIHTGLVLGALILTGCSSTPAPDASPPKDDPSSQSSAAEASAGTEISGTFPVGDRELFITCTGDGVPTVVLESGDGVPSEVMYRALILDLSPKVRVCSYDRSNTGQSETGAALPRRSREVLTDLHGLLEAADVPEPYVLVGHSAGGMLVQSYARNYPESIAGVVAMNPVPPWRAWEEEAFPEMTQGERRAESAYFRGGEGGSEGFDYREISAQYDDLEEPPGIPFHMLISSIAQCESPEDICGRTYPVYTDTMKQIADHWPEGHFTQTVSGHEIYLDDPDAVLTAINDVLTRAAGK
jgi:pimeloyl-ACP methyl ester carboxylesterase